MAAYLLDRAAATLASHIEEAMRKASDGKSGPAAEAASWNALAPYINAEQKFASPRVGNY